MAQTLAYIMKMYLCLLAFALCIRWSKSHRSIRETVTNFITIIWLVTNAALEIMPMRGPSPTPNGSPLRTGLGGSVVTERWVTRTFSSSYYRFSGWYPRGPSFNLFRLQVCNLIWFGSIREGANLNMSGVAFALDFWLEGCGRVIWKPSLYSCWPTSKCIYLTGNFCSPVTGAGSLHSVAGGRVATFFKTGTCS